MMSIWGPGYGEVPQAFQTRHPFRMNIRLEEFVKEYICMEQDIHIEDMQ